MATLGPAAPRRAGATRIRMPGEWSMAGGTAFGRRAAMLLPLAGLAGCGMFDSWFGSNKVPLPGKREDVLTPGRGLEPASPRRTVALAPAVANPEWLQPGG